jgi:hypothetical protein
VAELLKRVPGLSRAHCVGFLVDGVALRRGFLRVFRFCHFSCLCTSVRSFVVGWLDSTADAHSAPNLVPNRECAELYVRPPPPRFLVTLLLHSPRVTVVRITQRLYCLGYSLDDRGIGLRFPLWTGDFCVYSVQSGTGVHSAS